MPIDEKRWKEIMVESGRMPDDNGVWHYNPVELLKKSKKTIEQV